MQMHDVFIIWIMMMEFRSLQSKFGVIFFEIITIHKRGEDEKKDISVTIKYFSIVKSENLQRESLLGCKVSS